jgi:hypothetical protein
MTTRILHLTRCDFEESVTIGILNLSACVDELPMSVFVLNFGCHDGLVFLQSKITA